MGWDPSRPSCWSTWWGGDPQFEFGVTPWPPGFPPFQNSGNFLTSTFSTFYPSCARISNWCMSVENAGKVTLTIRIAVPRFLEKQPLRGAHESRGSTNGIFLGRKIAAHYLGDKKSAVSASFHNLLCKSNRNSELKGTWRNKIPGGLDDDHTNGLTNDRQLFMWIRGERGDRAQRRWWQIPA